MKVSNFLLRRRGQRHLSTSGTGSRPNVQQTSIPSSSTVIHAPQTTGEEHRILSFDELRELILHGKTDQIPNNKDIPDKLNVRIIDLYNVTLLIYHFRRRTLLQASRRRLHRRNHGRLCNECQLRGCHASSNTYSSPYAIFLLNEVMG